MPLQNRINKNLGLAACSIVMLSAVLACGFHVDLADGTPQVTGSILATSPTETTHPSPTLRLVTNPPPFPKTITPTEGLPPSQELPPPTFTIEPNHVVTPAEPPQTSISGMTDPDSSKSADQKRAQAGEDFRLNIFERPFAAESMQYLPGIDLVLGKLSLRGDWLYFSLFTIGDPVGSIFAVEIDTDMDGRGNYLVIADTDSSNWSSAGVSIYKDSNLDVGGGLPLISDDKPGNGYETSIMVHGTGANPDLAFARRLKGSQYGEQFAIQSGFFKIPVKFLWAGWTWQGTISPAWFDLNDHFSIESAGSPLLESGPLYPLKALSGIDNTCRWPYGFAAEGNEPGLCPKKAP